MRPPALVSIFRYGWLNISLHVLMLGRDLFLASLFGTTSQIDAWFAVFILPNFIFSITLSSLQGTLVPWFQKLNAQGSSKDQHIEHQRVLFLYIGMIGFISVLFFLSQSFFLDFLARRYPDMAIETLATYLKWSSLLLFIMSMGSFFRSLLQALHLSTQIAVAPMFSTTIVIGLLWLWSADKGVMSFVYALAIGALVETLTYIYFLTRRQAWNFWVKPTAPAHPLTKELQRNFLFLLLGSALQFSILFVDYFMALTFLGGGIAELTYGGKLSGALIGIVGGPLMVVVLPLVTEAIAQGWSRTQFDRFKKMATILLVVSTVVSLVLFSFSEELARLIFWRGNMSAEDVHVIAQIQGWYVLQLPAYFLKIIGTYVHHGLGSSRRLALIYGFNAALNIILDYVLIQYMGLPGIALGTTVIVYLSMIAVWWSLPAVLRKGDAG